MLPEQLAVVGGPILTALVRVDDQLLRFHPALAKIPIEGFHHQGRIHAVIQLPANNTAAVQINPDRQVPPAGTGADVGDVTHPAEICRWGLEVLLLQVLHHRTARRLHAAPDGSGGSGRSPCAPGTPPRSQRRLQHYGLGQSALPPTRKNHSPT